MPAPFDRRSAIGATASAALIAGRSAHAAGTIMAVRQVAYGEIDEAVEVVEIPAPVPQPGEVVITMEAAAMHLADVKFMRGTEGFDLYKLPRIMGTEGVGRISAIGDGVSGWNTGDRVFAPQGLGTFRQQLAAPADKLIAAPEDGDADQLALTTINGMTAYLLLEDYAKAKPGDWLLQNGANSSVGRYLFALARRKGVHVIGLVRRESLIPELMAGGADAVLVDSGDPNDMAAKTKAIAGDVPIKVGFDCVASSATTTIARCVVDGGEVVNYGYMTGEPCHMAFQDLWRRSVRLRGMNMRNPYSRDEVQEIYKFLAGLIANGTLKAAIAATYPLARIKDALAHQQETGTARPGKIIIHPNA